MQDSKPHGFLQKPDPASGQPAPATDNSALFGSGDEVSPEQQAYYGSQYNQPSSQFQPEKTGWIVSRKTILLIGIITAASAVAVFSITR